MDATTYPLSRSRELEKCSLRAALFSREPSTSYSSSTRCLLARETFGFTASYDAQEVLNWLGY